MRHTGLADSGSPAERGHCLNQLTISLIIAAGVMGTVSFVLIPLIIRFVLTPLMLRIEMKKGFAWTDEASRERLALMKPVLKKRLKSSERMRIGDDLKALLAVVSPPDKDGTLHFDFTILRALEISLLAYEDIYIFREKSMFLRYFLRRSVNWYRPFYRGYRAGQFFRQSRILRYMNRKGVFPQLIRLALVPILGIPGIILYSIRSLFLRLFWEGIIRGFYLKFLFRSAQYILHLYGGECPELAERKSQFSKQEIIRKYRHYDRELSLVPGAKGREDVLNAMIEEYRAIMKAAGLSPDENYSTRENAGSKRRQFNGMMSGFFRKTISAVNGEFSSNPEQVPIKEIVRHMYKRIPGVYYPGKEQPWECYSINQIVTAAYKLSIIGLGAVYSNAPGSRIALEKISVDIIRKVRDFSRQPLISLLKTKGMDSWKAVKPVLKARQLMKLRKVSPTAVASLGFPLFGRMLQDAGREIILYRIGRALIRYTILEEKDLPEP